MEEFLLAHQTQIYTLTYFGSIITIAIWEELAPRRELLASTRIRWFSNFSLIAIDNIVVRILMPWTSVSLAVLAVNQGWGFFQQIQTPYPLAFILSFLLLDFGRYVQHFMYHNVKILWRLHHMHHTDHDYDFSTGFRFHPFENILTVLMTSAVIILLGAPVVAVICSEIAVVLLAILSHGNVRYSQKIDRIVRVFLVTPEMHRVHHSTQLNESNSNFGTLFPWWDKICRTYIAQPAAGHIDMKIGITGYEDPKYLTLRWMLSAPFLRKKKHQ